MVKTKIKAKPDARPVLHIPFIKYDLWLVDLWAAPFVPLKPVCDALGLNLKNQVSRLRRSKKPYGLKSVAATEGGELLHLEAIPLENLSAFLFTLRISTPNLMLLLKQQAPKALIFFWSRYQRDYVSPKAVAADLDTLARMSRSQDQEVPVERRARITPDVISRIKTMGNSGVTISHIARQLRYSRTTVSLILSDKYKTESSGTYSST